MGPGQSLLGSKWRDKNTTRAMGLQAVFALVAKPWERSFIASKPPLTSSLAPLSLSGESLDSPSGWTSRSQTQRFEEILLLWFPRKALGSFSSGPLTLLRVASGNLSGARGS